MNATIHTRTHSLTRARRNSALLLAAALMAAGLAAQIHAAEPATPPRWQVPIERLLEAKLADRLANLPLQLAAPGDTAIAREDARWRRPPANPQPNAIPTPTVQEKSS
ncbi:MAG: hypothetical protein IPJ33_03455 [Gammaproteobacteria bacterium]|nr:hypothetical protein [Gammaproteobacteria bacterium]MBP6050473.1 hypothetical protein [Pseudomonadales bacterium]MBK6583608.1 hypothetical protein [Gammaproteobacteria bacterium]MBK7169886.1 hypothetical protein [Gammaproteobacteria bacterium]MBK7521946.1 hypothetical protein [Gammaproteobacteria bacterium]